MLVVDNCCQVRKSVVGAIPEIKVALDVYHFLMRYLAVVITGVKNPHRGEVAKDIRDSILKSPAGDDGPASYWTKDKQKSRLIAAYEKWSSHGSVWSAAAPKVHADQLAHVQKGCLARHHQDIASDGSRIEGSHKGWNSIQRAQPSGIEVYTALAHDFVLRRNLRVASAHKSNSRLKPANSPFIVFGSGSHHINLVTFLVTSFNALRHKEPENVKNTLRVLPLLPVVKTQEEFGLVQSCHTESFGGLIIKEELEDEQSGEAILTDLDQRADEAGEQDILNQLGIDQGLLSMPEICASQSSFESITLVSPEAESLSTTAKGKRKALEPPQDALDGNSPEPSRKKVHVSVSPDPSMELQSVQEGEMELIDCEISNDCVNELGIATTSHGLFKFKTPAVSHTLRQPRTSTLSELTKPLPISCSSLTRSEIIFSAATLINPQSLIIAGGDEFYLFMDLLVRTTHQWTSFGMNSQKWVTATRLYNEAFAERQNAKGVSTIIKKNPRALMDKLGEIEPKIAKRIATQNYTSLRSNSEAFWRKHCSAVSLTKNEGMDRMVPTSIPASEAAGKIRKAATCSRCKTIMYPGPTGSLDNHKKGYCSDGVRQKPKIESNDGLLPEWPQPIGIFTTGTHFHPITFLSTIRQIYDKVVEGTISDVEYSMEDEAFSRLLSSRIKVHDGKSFFRMYDLDINPDEGVPSLLVEIDGVKFLRVDCLGV